MRNIWVGRCWKPPKQTETRIFYLYWSNFAYFIHSWGLLSYDSIKFWTSSTLMQSLSKMLCRIFIKSSRVSGLPTSVCSIAVLKRRVFSLSGISLQLKLQVVKTFYFAQSFSFYRPAPQIYFGGEGGGELETDCTITENGERPHLTVQLKFWIFSRWKVTETRGCIFTTLTL